MEDFDERLAALEADLKVHGTELMHHLDSLHSNIRTQINLKENPLDEIKLLQHDVSDVLREAKENRDYQVENAEEIERVQKLMETLSIISSVAAYIAHCDEKINGDNIIDAARLVARLAEEVDNLPTPNTDIGSGKVCASLRKESQLLKFRFHSRLKRLMGHSVQIEVGTIMVRKSLSGILKGEDIVPQNPILLEHLWEALLITGNAEGEVKAMIRNAWDSIMKPIWKEQKLTIPKIIRGDFAELSYPTIQRDSSSLTKTGICSFLVCIARISRLTSSEQILKMPLDLVECPFRNFWITLRIS